MNGRMPSREVTSHGSAQLSRAKTSSEPSAASTNTSSHLKGIEQSCGNCLCVLSFLRLPRP